jgi:hypothetical protein
MPEDVLFKTLYQLTAQLKGAPLREDEKEGIAEGFSRASGSPYDKAISAITGVLHCEPSLIFEKGEALESVKKMLQDIKAQAEAMAR